MPTHPTSSIAVPPAGTHGGDGPAVEAALGLAPGSLLDLSQNLNPFAPPAADVVRRHLDTVTHYPDHRTATRLLAGAIGVDPARLLLTNGGSEAIHLVAAELGGRVVDEPEFALHPRGTTGPRWRTNPHSPTGRLATDDQRADVWDEAFHALATGEWSAHRGGVVVGSLTKTFACPGLRLGYVVADDVQRFARHQPHWPVSALSLACLPDLLGAADLAGWSRQVAEARTALADTLARHGLDVEAHDAPWVLVHDAPGLRAALAPYGVLVRDCASFGLPGTMRVAVPTPEDLPRVERALGACADERLV
ncbi:MAG: aminotransferase class I/II-fold pyridoxal phosphate-dependent enzyme [Nocardioides sp.]|nr:aminotransferase class I/II-fold pyridoxal phosphate-dependent enzyme [Nocardioides sp.]